jgi:hypothetical protein
MVVGRGMISALRLARYYCEKVMFPVLIGRLENRPAKRPGHTNWSESPLMWQQRK